MRILPQIEIVRYNREAQQQRMGDREFALEELSNDILVRILSMLSLKEAAATSILSTRWRYLWRFTTTLNFDFDASLLPSFMNISQVENYINNEKRESFVNWVNTVVDQHSGGIDLFRLNYSLSQSDRFSIDKWVEFALRNRSLEKLELDFHLIFKVEFSNVFKLSHQFFSDIGQYIGLKSLKVLFLNYVGVSGKHVTDLLSNAPLLEHLSVGSSPELVHLRVFGQSLALKHLEILGCANLKTVEIFEVNIVSLCFQNVTFAQSINASNFIVRNVPMLVELTCIYPYVLHFSKLFKQIEVLRMGDSTMVVERRRYAYPEIQNLKRLDLKLYCDDYNGGCGLGNMRVLIEAFCNLEKLVLHVHRYFPFSRERNINVYQEPLRRPHECLKEVEILGYNAFGDNECITYLIKHCVALEKIIINCKFNNLPRLLVPPSKQKILEHEEFARTHAMTLLKRHIPSNIEFVCI